MAMTIVLILMIVLTLISLWVLFFNNWGFSKNKIVVVPSYANVSILEQKDKDLAEKVKSQKELLDDTDYILDNMMQKIVEGYASCDHEFVLDEFRNRLLGTKNGDFHRCAKCGFEV